MYEHASKHNNTKDYTNTPWQLIHPKQVWSLAHERPPAFVELGRPVIIITTATIITILTIIMITTTNYYYYYYYYYYYSYGAYYYRY